MTRSFIVISDSEGYEHYSKSQFFAKHIPSTPDYQERPRLIFLGDAVDKGPHGLEILRDLTSEATNAIKIAGNRDANKVRFLELFSTEFIYNFGNINGDYDHAPFWSPDDKFKPSKFFDTIAMTYSHYQTLSFAEKQVIVLKWILAQTMGAPMAFEYRRQELCQLMQINVDDSSKESYISEMDLLVARSFVEEILLPEHLSILTTHHKEENVLTVNINANLLQKYQHQTYHFQGQMYLYLFDAHLFYLEGKNLFSHSMLNLDLVKHLENRDDFETWIGAQNQSFKANLYDYYSYAMEHFKTHGSTNLVSTVGIQCHGMVLAALPYKKEKPFDELVISFNSATLTESDINATADFLKQIGIYTHHYGHQPQAHRFPFCQYVNDVKLIGYDTSWSIDENKKTKQEPVAYGAIVSENTTFISDNCSYFINTIDPMIGRLVLIPEEFDGIKPGTYRVSSQQLGLDILYHLTQQGSGPAFPGGPVVFKDVLAGQHVLLPREKILPYLKEDRKDKKSSNTCFTFFEKDSDELKRKSSDEEEKDNGKCPKFN